MHDLIPYRPVLHELRFLDHAPNPRRRSSSWWTRRSADATEDGVARLKIRNIEP